MDDRGMQRLAAVLRDQGFDIVRFNFLYRESGSRRPDPMPRLIECFEAVVAHARAELGMTHVIIGGRSMGGRVASMMAARSFHCDGLLLLAYPLHPRGNRNNYATRTCRGSKRPSCASTARAIRSARAS
jgi:predicted alpha/beta-hydrolase family hydrolase